MRRSVLALGWVLWAHEMAAVGDKMVDRGYTAVDSFETRQQCHAALSDYSSLKLVRQGKVKWINPGDATLTISQEPPEAFPYGNLSGRREQMTIRGTRLTTKPPPAGEDIDPFD